MSWSTINSTKRWFWHGLFRFWILNNIANSILHMFMVSFIIRCQRHFYIWNRTVIGIPWMIKFEVRKNILELLLHLVFVSQNWLRCYWRSLTLHSRTSVCIWVLLNIQKESKILLIFRFSTLQFNIHLFCLLNTLVQ